MFTVVILPLSGAASFTRVLGCPRSPSSRNETFIESTSSNERCAIGLRYSPIPYLEACYGAQLRHERDPDDRRDACAPRRVHAVDPVALGPPRQRAGAS